MSKSRFFQQVLTLSALFVVTAVAAMPQNGNRRNQGSTSIAISRAAIRAEERIVGFRIEVAAGMIQSVSGIPKGWNVVIDNDASWRTKVEGTALVGAAAISADDLKKVRIVVQKDETYLKFDLSGSVVATIDFEKERSFALTSSDFETSPPR